MAGTGSCCSSCGTLLQSSEQVLLPLGAVTAGTSICVWYSMHQLPSVPSHRRLIASVSLGLGFTDCCCAPVDAALLFLVLVLASF